MHPVRSRTAVSLVVGAVLVCSAACADTLDAKAVKAGGVLFARLATPGLVQTRTVIVAR